MVKRILNIWILIAGCLLVSSDAVFAHGVVHEQIEVMNELIKNDPINTRFLIKRGLLYQEDQNWLKASNDFDLARHIEPSQSIVDLHEARMWFTAKRPGLALPFVNQFLKRHPENISALVLRGSAYLQLGKPEAAVSDFSRVVKQSKTVLPNMYLQWAKAQARVSPLNRQLVHQIIQSGLEQFGPLVVLLQYVLEFDRKHQDYQSALSWIEQLPVQLSKQPYWLVEKANILSILNSKIDANSHYQLAFNVLQQKQRSGRFNKADKKLFAEIKRNLKLE